MTDFAPRFLADYAKPLFSIETVNLTFDLFDTETLVTNTMQVNRAGEHNAALVLDGEHLTLQSVSIDGATLTPEHYQLTDNSLTIQPNAASFELTIVTKINPQDNSSLEGLFKSGGAFCTQCEAEGFRRITYYLDRPDVMSVFTTKVIADQATYPYLLANGNSIDKGQLANGRHFVSWHDPYPKPSYLFALVAGDFDLLSDRYTTSEGRDVTLEIFVDKGNLNKAHHAMASLKHSMKWDEDTFGLAYDLDIYMIVAVDFFNMGAMENKGLNVFNSKYVLADETSATDTDYFNIEAVIAHEYFHNWTGNRVTCRDWFQLSLKEGLTVFRDQQFSADMHSAAVTRIQNVKVLRAMQFAEDAGPMSHPIRPEKVVEMNNFYTLTVYEKGSEVIRMLHTLLGKDGFRKGMDLYFKRFDGMAVTCDDFVEAMADATNVDLSLFKRWYSQSGTPTLTVTESFDPNTQQFSLTIEQSITKTTKEGQDNILHIPVKIELISTNNKTSQLLELTSQQQTWHFDGYSEKPIVALLGDFTAPVKVEFEQDDDELECIMTKAENEFCRWDAGQKLYTRYISKLLETPEYELPEQLLTSFISILTSDIDAALKAEQITLPSVNELAELFQQVDPVALCQAHQSLAIFFAQGAMSQLNAVYQESTETSYSNDGLSIAKRSLKNACLSYLATLDKADSMAQQQYAQSDNMADSLAALKVAATNNLPCFDDLMAQFESQWSDTTLVMDKWFMMAASHASDEIFQRMNKLLAHPLFTLNNPNRARSLLGAFSSANPKYFHCVSGKGYKLLAEQIAKLNDINPQVASRLITPLIQFKGLDKTRQVMIKAELERLMKLPKLSKDLKEKLEAALA